MARRRGAAKPVVDRGAEACIRDRSHGNSRLARRLGLDLKGKTAAGAEPGRAVARLTDLGHGQALRALFREDTPDGPKWSLGG